MAKSMSFTSHTQIAWQFENLESVDTLSSDVFNFDCSQWRLVLQKNQLVENSRIIYMYLKKLSPRSGIHNIDAISFIKAPHGVPLFEHHTSVAVSCDSSQFIWYTFEVDDLENAWKANVALTFVCRLSSNATESENIREAVKYNKSVQTPSYMDTTPFLENAIVDIVEVLKGGTDPDVVLKCANGFISAHKTVLSARSKVFAAMFRNNMSERQRGAVNILDVDYLIMQLLIQYIYSGKLQNLSMDSAEYIYAAADKYSVLSLKKLCSDFMMDNITDRNACSLLALADAHYDKLFKKSAVSFILDKRIPLADDVWEQFCQDYPYLAIEVLTCSYKTKLAFNNDSK